MIHKRLQTLLAFSYLLLVGIASHQTQAQSLAVTHCQGECPQYASQLSANRSNVVIHHLYAAGINGKTGVPDWSAYRLTSDAVGVASLLPRTWQPDRLIQFSPLEDIIVADAGEAELRLSETISNSSNPYAGGGPALVEPEDRARLAPMTSFANTPYWSDLNNFSNMVPMPAPLRLGPWLRLEQHLNRLVVQAEELYVITGPLYVIGSLSVTPSSEDLNPAAYYKMVSDGSSVAAFVFPENSSQSDRYCDYRANYQEIEQVADIHFFPGRSDMKESDALWQALGCGK